MKEMFEKLYRLITKNIFISDVIFLLIWLFISRYKDFFSRISRVAFVIAHIWANLTYYPIIRSKIISIFYFLNFDEAILRIFSKNTEWAAGFIGGIAHLLWIAFFLAPVMLEIYRWRKGN